MKNPEEKTAGRKPGSKNRNSLLASDRVEHYKELFHGFVSPFDMLILTMNGMDCDGQEIDVDFKTRIDCAKAAVAYTNPKLAQTEVVVEQEDTTTDEEKRARVEELLKSPALRELLTGEK